MDFIRDAIYRTLGVEGGYVNNPNDAGGETNWGITVAVARENGYTGSMAAMTRDQAYAIYKSQYFLKPGYEKVGKLSIAIAEELFDTGVNMGVTVSSGFLQRALNVLNRSHSASPLYPDLVVDGALGNASLSALETFLKARKKDGELVLLTMLNALQGTRYIELCEKREKNEEFLYGWFKNRVVI